MIFGLDGTAGAVGSLGLGTPPTSIERVKEILMAQRRSCKAVSTCEEAVEMWCGGYSRADGDNDGIPCENVCRSLSQVETIKKKIGC
ncbi:excalibur calcium-binding domain-containing protein [Microvirga lotononidis]|uniref:excalibur calcium-binding domain-containing protein n=1 Tax=Microvirga lotononidis TaxID=864069 RepID=UPI000A06B2A5|nr:excalibur calcium-binding domain-containing protein [Microvirga lotononidis]WQO30494.1 excalibur calcium-binding domain-containing protein [Microvirga lotononidis]